MARNNEFDKWAENFYKDSKSIYGTGQSGVYRDQTADALRKFEGELRRAQKKHPDQRPEHLMRKGETLKKRAAEAKRQKERADYRQRRNLPPSNSDL